MEKSVLGEHKKKEKQNIKANLLIQEHLEENTFNRVEQYGQNICGGTQYGGENLFSLLQLC